MMDKQLKQASEQLVQLKNDLMARKSSFMAPPSEPSRKPSIRKMSGAVQTIDIPIPEITIKETTPIMSPKEDKFLSEVQVWKSNNQYHGSHD
jgi:hypothetical protein